MIVYGGNPPEMDICQESQGSIWEAFVIIIGAIADVGSAERQSEDPDATVKTVGSTPPEFPKESTRARSSWDPAGCFTCHRPSSWICVAVSTPPASKAKRV
jgi:hypothetical protein